MHFATVTAVMVVEKPEQRSVPKINAAAVVAREMLMNTGITRASAKKANAPMPKRKAKKVKNTLEKVRSIRIQ